MFFPEFCLASKDETRILQLLPELINLLILFLSVCNDFEAVS